MLEDDGCECKAGAETLSPICVAMDGRFASSAATGPGAAAGDDDGGGEGKRDAPPDAARDADCPASAWPCCADLAPLLEVSDAGV